MSAEKCCGDLGYQLLGRVLFSAKPAAGTSVVPWLCDRPMPQLMYADMRPPTE
jgi:hypothetical protein